MSSQLRLQREEVIAVYADCAGCGAHLEVTEATGGYSGIYVDVIPCKACMEEAAGEARTANETAANS